VAPPKPAPPKPAGPLCVAKAGRPALPRPGGLRQPAVALRVTGAFARSPVGAPGADRVAIWRCCAAVARLGCWRARSVRCGVRSVGADSGLVRGADQGGVRIQVLDRVAKSILNPPPHHPPVAPPVLSPHHPPASPPFAPPIPPPILPVTRPNPTNRRALPDQSSSPAALAAFPAPVGRHLLRPCPAAPAPERFFLKPPRRSGNSSRRARGSECRFTRFDLRIRSRQPSLGEPG